MRLEGGLFQSSGRSAVSHMQYKKVKAVTYSIQASESELIPVTWQSACRQLVINTAEGWSVTEVHHTYLKNLKVTLKDWL